MSFFKRIQLDYRPKAYIQANKLTKQYIYDESAFIVTKNNFEETKLTYYFEFSTNEFDKDTFMNELKKQLAAKNIVLDNIIFSFVHSEKSTIIINTVNPDLERNSIEYSIAKLNLKKINDLISNNNFGFSFVNIDGKTIYVEARLTMEFDGFHSQHYRYNVLYTFNSTNFSDNSKRIEIKFVSALNNKNEAIKSGDKVYIYDKNDNFLVGNLNKERNTFLDNKIYFSDNELNRLMFEIDGFDNEEMLPEHTIPISDPIPNDYGFKIEILPPSIKNLFDGLNNNNFTKDDTISLDETIDINNFNTSLFYSLELGEIENDPNIADITYDIDELFLIFDGTNYSYTYDNDDIRTKIFFNAKRV